ncbi:DNA-directed RNA polymerases I and III subunit RPAC2 [Triplophysa rosa]|uniref:DNA-directed RNA polymerases I and III subunit RPAC2 n=1 Tax=Triplophysa rosa TaxID=992332 RepID=A0A9W7T2J6_TRIRA|nr:DNA-directed RNA polymerases I and III subunit RPAC2 [Triplophysa rosa]
MVEKCSVLESVQADGADEGSVTFVLQEEDHTLGNSLRYIIMKRFSGRDAVALAEHRQRAKLSFNIIKIIIKIFYIYNKA